MIAHNRRSGVVLVAVLVALLVVTLISAAIVRGLVVQHRQARIEQQRTQTFWLAESAVDRGIAQLRTNDEYEGETWQVSLTADGIEASGQAVIRVTSVEGSETRRSIQVEARCPMDSIESALLERDVTVDMRDWAKDP